jgi:uncharacterized membrane protein HdeD (DUF308 family)
MADALFVGVLLEAVPSLELRPLCFSVDVTVEATRGGVLAKSCARRGRHPSTAAARWTALLSCSARAAAPQRTLRHTPSRHQLRLGNPLSVASGAPGSRFASTRRIDGAAAASKPRMKEIAMTTTGTTGAMSAGAAGLVVRGLTTRWWAFVLRGVFAIAFGVFTWVYPGISLLSLVLLFGAYALGEGVFAIVAAIRNKNDVRPWWMLVLQGVAGVMTGLATLFVPGITALVLLLVIAAWAVVTGALQIAVAIRVRKEIEGEWLLAVGGAVSIAFGVLLVLFPGAGALALVLWIGTFMVFFGGLLVALGLRLRSVMKRHGTRPEGPGIGGTFAPSR